MIALLMMLLGTAWAGDDRPSGRYYDTDPHRLRITLHSMDRGSLRSLAMQERHGRVKVYQRQLADGTRVPVRFRDLEVPELVGMVMALTFDLENAESDMVISGFSEDLIPVTVWWDEPRTLVFETGSAMTSTYDVTRTPEVVAGRFGLPAFVDTDRVWDHRALGLVEEALSRLSPEELALVVDVPWVRASSPPVEAVAPMEGASLAAMYIVDEHGPRIEVYDVALAPPPRFVGSAYAPMPVAFDTILHETGHALSHARVRRARQELLALEGSLEGLKDDGEARQQAVDRMGSLARLLDRAGPQTPAAISMASVLGDEGAPTRYGMTAPEEAFADCFALFHGDPDALMRARPRAFDWFAAGRHLESAEP